MTARMHLTQAQTFNYAQARARCAAHGLVFDERLVPLCEHTFNEARLTQHQVDEILGAYVEASAWQWNRKNYTLRQRIFLALYWLGIGRSVGGGIMGV